MKRFLVAASFAILTFPSFALPTLGAVQEEIGKGHYAHAEDMMREVVAAKPDSARARYVYAEILAHDKHFALAAEEAAQAKRIDPSLGFTQPEKYNAFVQLLDRTQGATAGRAPSVAQVAAPVLRAPPAASPSGGIPGWAWGVGAAGLALVAWLAFGARRQAMVPGGPSLVPGASGGPGFSGFAPGYAAQGYAPGHAQGYSPAAPTASAGSGLLGTGLAVAGGVAAGMLAEKMFESHRDPVPGATGLLGLAGLTPDRFDDDTFDNTAERALTERPIDLGTGDGWGGGNDAAGASGDGDGW